MKAVIARMILVALVSSLALGCLPAPATVTAPAASPAPPPLASDTPPPPGPPSPTPRPPYRGDPVVVQENNSLPLYSFTGKTSEQLVADSRIGDGAYSAFWQNDLPHWSGILDQIVNFGVKRLDTSLPEVEPPIDWTWSETDIPPRWDQFIDGLNQNGIQVNYLIHFWDKEGHARGETLSTPRFKTDAQVQAYLDYVRLIVHHFKGRVQYYTIWSEPDYCGDEGIKCIEPNDYINLVRQTVPVIRQEDPEAKVSIAPVVLFFARDYLFKVLESDIMPLVDVVQWHGIYLAVPGSEFYGDYYYEYPQIIEQIRQTAKAHGFEGEFWGTELSYCSQEFPHCWAPDQPYGVLEADKLAAKYYDRLIVIQLGMDVGTGLASFIEEASGPWTIPTIRNLHTILAGTQPTSLPVEMENQPPDTATYAFALPNGDTLLALWTDGVAVEDDPGVGTTLALPGMDAQAVTAIDPLYGSEQELVTESENGNLMIRNLLVKDYPIIIRFASTAP